MDTISTTNNNNNIIINNSHSLMSVQQTTPTKRVTKPKKKNATKPIKVVYISNPMKIKTSASEFRALVQELTGQDAESPPDPARFNGGGEDECLNMKGDEHHKCVVPPSVDPDEGQLLPSSIESFEPLDDEVFTPQMIESISALLPPSIFNDSQHLHHW